MEKGGGGESPRSLLTRTVSFLPSSLSLSARARALRDRFANSKRSLSDSWTDQYLLDETSTEVQESPSDNTGSTQYLIKSCPGNNASVVIDGSATQTPSAAAAKTAAAYKAACSKPAMQSCSDMQRTAMPGSFVSQRSHSLDSLNNINVQNKDEPSGNPGTNISFPSPPLLDTPTLSPVHPMQFTFPTFSTLDFSSTTIPRPIKSASFRQISKQQSKDMLSFTTFSTSSLPPHLPPPPKSPIRKIIKNEEKHVPITPPPVQVPPKKILSTSSSHSNLSSTHLASSQQHSSPLACTNHEDIETNLQRDSSGSMDPEEGRDTVSDSPLVSSCHRNTPPSHLLLRSTAPEFKQKLRHQWSIDETRISKARDREDSDVSCSSTAPLRPAEKRRRFFMRKQPNSAPDSFDGPPITSTIKTKEYQHSVAFCLGNVLRSRNTEHSHQHQIPPPTIVLQNKLNSEPELGVEHLSDLSYPDADPPCHFCCKQTSTAIHDENRLKIVSRGLVRSRDGGREGGGTHYMNLPSPNVQTEENQEDVFKPNVHRPSSSYDDDDFSRRESCVTPPPIIGRRRRTEELDLEEVASTPPSSVLARRRALVPPKLMADNNGDQDSNDRKRLSSDGTGPRTRRSSIVVIPPMQICPGDLLVYSKVLTQRNNPFDGVNSRKNKNTWSLLKLFDRSNRVKSESLCGLEEVLSCIQRSEFKDEQLSKYRGMSWSEFVVYVDTERDGKCNNGIEGGKSPSSSSSSSNNHSSSCSPERPSSPVPNSIVATAVVEAPPPPTPPPVAESSKIKPLPERPSGFERRLRIGLMRTQSEKSFERRLTSSMWRGMDKPLPERILPRPAPLIPTLSEKDLLGSKEALASPVSTDSRNECKKREALWDLFQSECAFLYDHLMVLKNVFMEPLKTVQVDGFAMFAEPELLFGNLDELCCVTYAFCKEFINLILQNVGVGGEMNSTEILVKLFQKSSKADSVSQAYHCYALNYINALNYLETLRRHMEFCEFEKWCNRDPRCKKLQLTDLLVAPVQHIMKVPLILKEVENRTEEAEERDIIGRILEMEENSLRELDDKMKWLKNFERLLEIQRNIVWPSVFELDPKMYVPEFLKPALARQPCERIIVSPRRQIIMEGPLNLWDSGKPTEMYVVLFDDMLLISRRKKGLSKKKSSLTENWTSSCSRGSGGSGNEAAVRYVVYKQPLSLDRFFIHDVTVPEGSTCRLDAAFVLVSLNRFQQIVAVHTFQAASDQLKQNWLLKLRDTQDKWKRTLQHTVFRSPRVSTCSSRKSTT